MATWERRRDRARRLAMQLRREIGTQVRTTRTSHGISLRAAARSVGMDHAALGRLERGLTAGVSVEQVVLACVAVGLEPAFRGYPRGDPARDAGQLRLLARFRARLPATIVWHTEVPMPIPGDLRALDGVAVLGDRRVGVEAESRMSDVQALERRALLKQRDADVDVLILLVADTRANREALARHRSAVRGSFPLDTRETLAAIAAGKLPRANGIVVL